MEMNKRGTGNKSLKKNTPTEPHKLVTIYVNQAAPSFTMLNQVI
jgi:hypothetical protein